MCWGKPQAALLMLFSFPTAAWLSDIYVLKIQTSNRPILFSFEKVKDLVTLAVQIRIRESQTQI